MNTEHRGDINALLSKIIVHLIQQPTPAVLVDVANVIASSKGSLRERLGQVLEKVHGTPIMVYKNRENCQLNKGVVSSIKKFSSDNPDIMFILSVWYAKAKKGESHKEVKERYRREIKNQYPLFSRDDYVLLVLHTFLSGILYIPRILSYDKFRDIMKYKYITPFNVMLFFKGECHIFEFDCSKLHTSTYVSTE